MNDPDTTSSYAPQSPNLNAYSSYTSSLPPSQPEYQLPQQHDYSPYSAPSAYNPSPYYHPAPYSTSQPPITEHEMPEAPPTKRARRKAAPKNLKEEEEPWQSVEEESGTGSGSQAPSFAAAVVVKTKFPVARIKRIMQADEDVGKVAQVTPVIVSKALELFMISLVQKSAAEAKSRNAKKITAAHLKAAIAPDNQFDFLEDILSKVPDVPTQDKSEDTGEGKKPARKARKKKESSED